MLTPDAGKSGNKLDKISNTLTPAKLEKARLEIIAGANERTAADKKTVTVQFNPSEYTLERHVQLSQRHTLGGNGAPEQGQAPAGEPARLTVPLYFDTVTELPALGTTEDQKTVSGADGLVPLAREACGLGAKESPAAACAEIMQLVKFVRQCHQPPKVNFLWGTLDFIGMVESASAQYTMFAPGGTPIQARVTLTIVGEERAVIQQSTQQPNESPDRTKERTLAQGDQLWMIAGQEYDDPGQWKVIAEANGILNPRRLDRAVVLKVPSIQ